MRVGAEAGLSQASTVAQLPGGATVPPVAPEKPCGTVLAGTPLPPRC